MLKTYIPAIDVLLKRRDKLGTIVDDRKSELKIKISKYTEAATYICEISESNNIYLETIYSLLIQNIFAEISEYNNWNAIYLLARTLATELVNNGYSAEYIYEELTNAFLDREKMVQCDEQILIDFFNKFTFKLKSYQVVFGINAETARILKHFKEINVKRPSNNIKEKLNLKHPEDCIVEVDVKDVDKHQAANAAYGYINTIIGLHRISQHHKPTLIKPIAQVNENGEASTVVSTKIIKIRNNILLRANNENQIQSYFFDKQLLNKDTPKTFLRAVSLHNNALDSKEPANQLLYLWTAVETLIEFKSGDEDKINVICDILTSILNRSYLYNHITQLYKDIIAVCEKDAGDTLSSIIGGEQPVWELAKILSVKDCQEDYDKLYHLFEEYPLLQYRMEYFSKKVFVNSESVYKELVRHKAKLRWHIMRIYRNRNMIVHNGEFMPYLNIILGNLHYYIDAMFDLLIEYYHLKIKHNQTIFYHVQKEEMQYWNCLGLDDKGKKIVSREIDASNYVEIIFNNYKGNAIKNMVQQAIINMQTNSGQQS